MLSHSAKSASQLFEDRVAKIPNHIAVICGDVQLTYHELSLKSDQLAKYLRLKGVKSETLVALSVENDLDLIISLLGILKAGGTYLPLDPTYPTDRLQFMLEDARPYILLTQSHLAHLFLSCMSKVVHLDEIWRKTPPFTDREKLHPASIAKPENVAYVIYTSGSTGKPKGVLIEHVSLTNGILARLEFYPIAITSLLLGSIGFDTSIMIILQTLISGGRLYVPKCKSPIDADKIIELIHGNSINFLLCVPSLYVMILQKRIPLTTLKQVVLGGENISHFIPDMHSKFAPNAFLHNEYGPTEAGICTTAAKLYDPLLNVKYIK